MVFSCRLDNMDTISKALRAPPVSPPLNASNFIGSIGLSVKSRKQDKEDFFEAKLLSLNEPKAHRLAPCVSEEPLVYSTVGSQPIVCPNPVLKPFEALPQPLETFSMDEWEAVEILTDLTLVEQDLLDEEIRKLERLDGLSQVRLRRQERTYPRNTTENGAMSILALIGNELRRLMAIRNTYHTNFVFLDLLVDLGIMLVMMMCYMYISILLLTTLPALIEGPMLFPAALSLSLWNFLSLITSSSKRDKLLQVLSLRFPLSEGCENYFWLSNFNLVLLAPLSEEIFKKWVPFGYLMPFGEYFLYLQSGIPSSVRMAPLIMHLLTLQVPFLPGLLLHTLWNIGCVRCLGDDFLSQGIGMIQAVIGTSFPIWAQEFFTDSHDEFALDPSWAFASISNVMAVKDLGRRRIAENVQPSPDEKIWSFLLPRYDGKRTNPGLSRGRRAPPSQLVSRGGMPNVPRILPECVSMCNVRVFIPEPVGRTWVEPVRTTPLNVSIRKVREKRRDFSGGGEQGDSEFSLSALRKTTVARAIHLSRTILSRKERMKLLKKEKVDLMDRNQALLLRSVIEDRDSYQRFLTLLGTIDPVVREGTLREWFDSMRASKSDTPSEERPKLIRTLWLNSSRAPTVDEGVKSPLNVVYDSIIDYGSKIGYDIKPFLPYDLFISVVQLLSSTTALGGVTALESISLSIQKLGLDVETRNLMVKSLALAGAGLLVGKLVDLTGIRGEHIKREGLYELGDFYNKFVSSPLSIRIVALVTALLPLMIKGEHAFIGTQMLSEIGKWLGEVHSSAGTPLTLLINFFTFIYERVAKFHETGNFIDLLGTSPAVEWLDKASAVTKDMALCRANPSMSKPREIILRGRVLVRKSTTLKESLVAMKARALDEELTNFENSLSKTRKEPIGFIFTGPPGCGKTVMVDLLHKSYKQVKGIAPDVQVMYPWSPDKYQSPCSLVSIIHVNDAFQVKDESAEKSQLSLFQSFVDSFPLQASGAGVTEKNVDLNPDIVIASTNNKHFTFARSTTGADKLDRRYNMVDFSFTPACVAEAARLKIPVAQFFKTHGKDCGFPCVQYKLGYMVNDGNSNVINFAIQREFDPPFSTTNPFELIGIILHLEKMRPDPLDLVSHSGEEMCLCGLPKGIKYCGCKATEPDSPESDVEEVEVEDVFPEGLTPACQIIGATALTTFFLLRQLSGKRPLFNIGIEAKVSWPGPGIMFQEFVTKNNEFMYKHGMKILAALGWIKIILTLLERVNQEGTIQSTPSYPLPPSSEIVRLNQSTAAPWLGAMDNSYVVDLSGKLKMHGLLVNPNLICIPKHFFEDKDQFIYKLHETFVVTFRGVDYKIKFDPNLCVATGRDVSYYYVPNLASAVGSIFGKLPDKPTVPMERCSLGINKDLVVRPDLTYEAVTAPGDCGLPLIGSATGTIYGFHVGRYAISQRRIAEPLYRTDVREAMHILDKRGVTVDLFDDKLPELVENMLSSGLIKEGVHPKSDAGWYDRNVKPLINCDHFPVGHVTEYGKPKFSAHQTTLWNTFADRCKAYGKPYSGKAKLQPDGSWQSATTIRLDACDHAASEVDHTYASLALDALVDDLNFLPSDKATPLSDYTALCGSDLSVLINGKDVTKSIGRTLQASGLTKEEVFKFISPGVYEVHPAFKRRAEELERHLKSDEPLTMPFVSAVPKDEVYPEEKADLGRKRFFYLSDVYDNHVMRKYLLPIIDFLLSRPFDSKIIATINAGSDQWKTLYKHLTKFGPEVIDGDQKTMDVRHKALMAYYARFMGKIGAKLGYTPEEVRIVERICLRSSRYLLEIEGLFFICFCGLVSGRADTIICNSIILLLLFYIIFFKNRPPGDPTTPKESLALAATGDDSAANVARAIARWYTGELIRKEMLVMGYIMTAGDKSPEVGPKPITSISYLKRRFVPDGERVWAPLSQDSIFKSLAYSIGSKDLKYQVERDISASHSAVREGFLHGRTFFENLKKELETCWPDEIFPTYDDLLDDYLHGCFETWSTRFASNIAYQPPSERREREGGDVQSNRVEYTAGVVYPLESDAFRSGPTSSRGALEDFPVSPNYEKCGGTNSFLIHSSSELNSTMEVHLNGLTTPVSLDPFPTINTITQVAQPEASKINSLETSTNFFAVPRLLTYIQFGDTTPFYLMDRFNASSNVHRRLQQWAVWRGDMKIEIRYTGSSNLLGLTRFYFTPTLRGQPRTSYEVALDLDDEANDAIGSSLLPHLDIDVSCSCQKEIILPFVSSRAMLPYSQSVPGDSWVARQIAINPIKTASGITAPTVTLEMWISFQNLENDLLVPEGEVSMGVLSEALAYGASLGRRASSYISTFAKLAEYGSEAFAKMGLSRPTVPIKKTVLAKTKSTLTYMSGEPDFSTVLGSSPYMSRDISVLERPAYVSSVSEMARIWCNSHANVAAGTTLYIRPGHYIGSFMSTFRPDVLGYLGMMHEAWVGDIEVRLQVISSPLIRTRIGVNIYPYGASARPTFVTDGSVLAHTFDVCGSVDFEFTVPYLSYEPFRRTGLSVAQNINEASSIKFFFLEVPLGPSATPVYPMVNVWTRSGDDFAFLFPSLAGSDGILIAEGLVSDAIARVGEDCDNLKLLAARKCSMANFVNTKISLPADGWAPGEEGGLIPIVASWTFDTFIRQAFWGFTGGTRFTLSSTSNVMSVIQCAYTIPFTEASPRLEDSRGDVVYDPAVEKFVEVTVPDRSVAIFKHVDRVFPVDNVLACECLRLGPLDGTSEVGKSIRLYQSAGEDRAFILFKGPPRFKLTA